MAVSIFHEPVPYYHQQFYGCKNDEKGSYPVAFNNNGKNKQQQKVGNLAKPAHYIVYFSNAHRSGTSQGKLIQQ
jgi:hypothetical protein